MKLFLRSRIKAKIASTQENIKILDGIKKNPRSTTNEYLQAYKSLKMETYLLTVLKQLL